jgi:hypothetical protein
MRSAKPVPLGPPWLRCAFCVVAFTLYMSITGVLVLYPERWGACLGAVIIISPFAVCGFYTVIKGTSPAVSHSMTLKTPSVGLSSSFHSDDRK